MIIAIAAIGGVAVGVIATLIYVGIKFAKGFRW